MAARAAAAARAMVAGSMGRAYPETGAGCVRCGTLARGHGRAAARARG